MISAPGFSRRSAVAALLVASACTSTTPSLRAAPSTRSDDVLLLDVVDREGGAKHAIRLTLPISEDGSSTLDTRAGEASYRVRVHRQRSSEASTLQIGVVRNDLRRLERGDRRRDISLDVRVKLARGKRAVLTRLERPDGTSTEIAATLR